MYRCKTYENNEIAEKRYKNSCLTDNPKDLQKYNDSYLCKMCRFTR